MSDLMRQTLRIAGISMGTIFGVMAFLYVAIKLLGRVPVKDKEQPAG